MRSVYWQHAQGLESRIGNLISEVQWILKCAHFVWAAEMIIA